MANSRNWYKELKSNWELSPCISSGKARNIPLSWRATIGGITMLKQKKGDMIAVVGFTGIRFADSEVIRASKEEIVVMKKDGTEMVFSRKTGVQTNCDKGKEKFANKVMNLEDAPVNKPKAPKKEEKKDEKKGGKKPSKPVVEEVEDDEDDEEEEVAETPKEKKARLAKEAEAAKKAADKKKAAKKPVVVEEEEDFEDEDEDDFEDEE